jgi:hypothetical protein
MTTIQNVRNCGVRDWKTVPGVQFLQRDAGSRIAGNAARLPQAPSSQSPIYFVS